MLWITVAAFASLSHVDVCAEPGFTSRSCGHQGAPGEDRGLASSKRSLLQVGLRAEAEQMQVQIEAIQSQIDEHDPLPKRIEAAQSRYEASMARVSRNEAYVERAKQSLESAKEKCQTAKALLDSLSDQLRLMTAGSAYQAHDLATAQKTEDVLLKMSDVLQRLVLSSVQPGTTLSLPSDAKEAITSLLEESAMVTSRPPTNLEVNYRQVPLDWDPSATPVPQLDQSEDDEDELLSDASGPAKKASFRHFRQSTLFLSR